MTQTLNIIWCCLWWCTWNRLPLHQGNGFISALSNIITFQFALMVKRDKCIHILWTVFLA